MRAPFSICSIAPSSSRVLFLPVSSLPLISPLAIAAQPPPPPWLLIVVIAFRNLARSISSSWLLAATQLSSPWPTLACRPSHRNAAAVARRRTRFVASSFATT
ncbi:hypothetical protein NL676_033155 [Syzygium grande]|nr:hypothetical protein NL676_033155 [Syzygium grande]